MVKDIKYILEPKAYDLQCTDSLELQGYILLRSPEVSLLLTQMINDEHSSTLLQWVIYSEQRIFELFLLIFSYTSKSARKVTEDGRVTFGH